MVSKQREELPSFPRDKDYLRNADMEKAQHKFTCGCAFLYVRNSIGRQEMMSKA